MSEIYRPDTLRGYIGQDQLKKNIGTLLAAAKRDGRPVDHALFYGAPGCIAGNAEVIINRAGKGFRLSMSEFVRRFNGGVAGGKTWRGSIATKVQFLGGDNAGRMATVVNAVYSGDKETFEVTTDSGRSVRATADHKFMTTNGWTELSHLIVGDSVSVLRKPEAGKRNKIRYAVVDHMANHPFCHKSEYFVNRKDRPNKSIARYARVEYHRLVEEANLNGLTVDEFIIRIRANDIENLNFIDSSVFAVHHIDRNPKNNDLSNLSVVTHEEHRKIHSEHTYKNVLWRRSEEKIISIVRHGVEPTYDISIAESGHNFTANGFIVHNCGKTTIARIIAHETGGKLISTIAPAIDCVSDLVQILLRIKRGDVLFIDEIHGLPRLVEETLYDSMEMRRVSVTVGRECVRSLTIPLPEFTVVGATTRLHKVTQPLRDRFSGGVFKVEYYTSPQLEDILKVAAEKSEFEIDRPALSVLAGRGRGTPRVALNLLRWAANTSKALGVAIDEQIALKACEAKGIDRLGLDQDRRDYLITLYKRGGVAGLKSMMRMLNKEEGDVELLEADLLRSGMIEYGDDGRAITPLGVEHLKATSPEMVMLKSKRKLSR